MRYASDEFKIGCWRDRARVINDLSLEDLRDPELRTRMEQIASPTSGLSDSTYVRNRCRCLLDEYYQKKGR